MKNRIVSNSMKDLRSLQGVLLLFLCMGLCGCAPSIITENKNVRERSIDLSSLSYANVALMPFRSTLGYPIRNNTVKEHLSSRLIRDFPQINFIQPGQLGKIMAMSGREVFSQYRTLSDKYFARGMFRKDDLAIFDSADIDYIIAVSLNGGSQQHFYPMSYIFVMSLQIWDVNTGQIVWDTTQEGQVIIEFEDENKKDKTALMRHLCDSVLANLS